MPKTPDEIKKGLECCTEPSGSMCPFCPYAENGYVSDTCREEMAADALALIQPLEAERDSAVADIKQMVLDPYEPCFCDYCKLTEEECARSNCKGRSAFVWRGVQKEE